jgi:hypothetical protein
MMGMINDAWTASYCCILSGSIRLDFLISSD